VLPVAARRRVLTDNTFWHARWDFFIDFVIIIGIFFIDFVIFIDSVSGSQQDGKGGSDLL
jgi:hypothetical protein